MPAAIPVIIAIGTKAAAWVVALTIASAAYGYIAADEAKDKARRRYNDSLQDRRLVVRGGTAPRKWALGRVRLGGALVYADTVGVNKRLFDSELALCNGPIDAVEGYWLNDEYFSAAEVSSNRPTVGKYAKAASQSTATEGRLVNGNTFTLAYAPVSNSLAISIDQGGDNGYTTLTGFTVVGNTVTLPSSINGQIWCDYAYISADAPLLIQWTLGNHTEAMSWPGVETLGRAVSDKCLGVASIRTLMGWDENLYQQGAPVVNALVRGIKVPDPRTNTTVWTSNPALLAAWWATLPRAQGGCGRPPESINTASVIAAANICDELITVRKRVGVGYEQVKRYECHTVLSTDASPEANLRTILETMAGEFPFTSGQYVLVAGAFRAPTLVLTDDDVAAGQPIRISPNTGGFDAIPNMVTATFADAAQGYAETSAPDVVNDTYVEDDGGAEEPLALTLPATTDARQANYLMGVALERTRPGFAAELTVKGVGANISLLQGLTLSLQGYEAFAGKTWEVRARTNNFNGTYTLRLAETKANIWALDADRYTPTSVPTPPDLSYLWSVANVASLAATAGQPTELPDGTVVTRVSVTWASHTQDYVRQSGAIELRYRRVESTTYAAVPEVPGSAVATTITLAATANARYIIEARARNGVGAVSAWAVVPLDVVVGSVASNITARLTSPSVTLSADAAGVVQSYTGATTTVQIVVDGVDVTGLWTKSRTNSSGVTSTLVGAVLTVLDLADSVGAGYVDILCERLGWPSQTLRYGITKTKGGVDGAGNITWTTRGGVVMNGSTATKTGGSNDWNGEAASVQGFSGGCYVAFTAGQTNKPVMVGLNGDPTSSPNYQSIDFAFYLTGTGVLGIYESDVYVSTAGSYDTSTRHEIRHSGGFVRYYKNGEVIRSVALGDDAVLYADASFSDIGGSVENLVFGPVGAKGAQGPAGYNGATVTIYKRGATEPSGPTATVTYTFATKALTGLDSGWSIGWPPGDGPVWAKVVSFSGQGATDTAAPGEWTQAEIAAQNGADGLNRSPVYLYQRTSSATPPLLPSVDVTYNFDTGAVTGANNGWVSPLPATGGAYRWVTLATAASAGSTDLLPPSGWSEQRLFSQDGEDGAPGSDGAPGAPGADGGYIDYRFIRSVTPPATPTGNTPVSWSDGPPAGTDPLYFVKGNKTAAGVLIGAWSTPARLDGEGQQVEFSVDGATAWHTPATGADKFMRTRIGVGAWQGPFKIVAEEAGPVPRALPKLFAEQYAINPATATAGHRFKSDGRIQTRSGATWVDRVNWYFPTTSGVGSGWHIRRTHISGTVPAGGGTMTAGTWLQLNADRDVLMSQTADGTTTCNELYELSNDGGATIYSVGDGIVTVTRATEA